MEMATATKSKRRAAYALTRSKFLTSGERAQLIAVLERALKTPKGNRDALLIFVALHTGGRAKEILNLKKSDFDQTRHSIYVTGLKGSRDREIPIPKWLTHELADHLRAAAATDFIFPITYNRFRQIWLFYRPVGKKLHSLRHTFAMDVYGREKDVRLLQLALGHKSILNTMVYVDFFYSLNELRRLAE